MLPLLYCLSVYRYLTFTILFEKSQACQATIFNYNKSHLLASPGQNRFDHAIEFKMEIMVVLSGAETNAFR